MRTPEGCCWRTVGLLWFMAGPAITPAADMLVESLELSGRGGQIERFHQIWDEKTGSNSVAKLNMLPHPTRLQMNHRYQGRQAQGHFPSCSKSPNTNFSHDDDPLKPKLPNFATVRSSQNHHRGSRPSDPILPPNKNQPPTHGQRS
jgi:hypothetical protein